MRRGRKPKPTALRKLSGNAGKRKLNAREPVPPSPADLLIPSSWLDKVAQQEWKRIAPTLKSLGLLTMVDRAGLEGYCMSYSRWILAEQILAKKGLTFSTKSGYEQQRPEVAIALRSAAQMHSFAAEFGFTPASRTRVKGSGEGEDDEVAAFLKRRNRPGAAEPPEGDDAPGRSVH